MSDDNFFQTTVNAMNLEKLNEIYDAYEKSPQTLGRFIPCIGTVMFPILNQLETIAENATTARKLILAKLEAQFLREFLMVVMSSTRCLTGEAPNWMSGSGRLAARSTVFHATSCACIFLKVPTQTQSDNGSGPTAPAHAPGNGVGTPLGMMTCCRTWLNVVPIVVTANQEHLVDGKRHQRIDITVRPTSQTP